LYITAAESPSQRTQHIASTEIFHSTPITETVAEERKLLQLHRKYILSHIKSGFIIVDQNRAHQRILIDQLTEQSQQKNSNSQQLLFPEDLEVSAEDATLIHS